VRRTSPQRTAAAHEAAWRNDLNLLPTATSPPPAPPPLPPLPRRGKDRSRSRENRHGRNRICMAERDRRSSIAIQEARLSDERCAQDGSVVQTSGGCDVVRRVKQR
jgi:hypothetical protein